MNPTQLLGLSAGAFTTIAFLPQVIKTWKSRSAKDLSLGMFSLFCLGVAMWLAYGILVNDIPVIAANLLTLILAGILLFFNFVLRIRLASLCFSDKISPLKHEGTCA